MASFDIPEYMTFEELQKRFSEVYDKIFGDDLAYKSIIVVPSLTLDKKILSKVVGHCHYEERMLCMLLLLRMPKTQVTFISSIPISPTIIDYYLHMLPGVTSAQAHERLKIMHCYDGSDTSLTEKILQRPRLIQRIRDNITHPEGAHIICFNVTEHEKKLAELLQVPIYGCHPSLNYLGSKSGSRQLFKDCGVLLPMGFENIHNEEDIIKGIRYMLSQDKEIRKVVLKLNEGFSGDGNAIVAIPDVATSMSNSEWAEYLKNHVKIVAADLTYRDFMKKMAKMGGIIEKYINAEVVHSPSVQVRISPVGQITIISTHDQVLGGESCQVYQGASFPALEDYAVELADITYTIAEKLRDLGVIGRWGVDFMSTFKDGRWTHYAIEINLRKGGTTHPYLMLKFLTDGRYDASSGHYYLNNGKQRYYFATDNLQDPAYKGLTPYDLLEIIMYHGLHFDPAKNEGVMFHLISALSEYGKLGMVCIASSRQKTIELHQNVVQILNEEVHKDI